MLLLGTALASSLIALPALTATPARAQTTECSGPGEPAPGPTPILEVTAAANEPIVCVNDDERVSNAASNNNAIDLRTDGDGSFIDLNNSGGLTASSAAGDAAGIFAYTRDNGSPITIFNSGDIVVSSADDGYGIRAQADGVGNSVSVTNSGGIRVSAADNATAIFARSSFNPDSPVTVINSAALWVQAGGDGEGIFAVAGNPRSNLTVDNSGDIVVDAGENGFGIYADTASSDSRLSLFNSGAIAVSAIDDAFGIYAIVRNRNSPLLLENIGDIVVQSAADAYGIRAESGSSGVGDNSPITVMNSGNLEVSGGGDGFGISAYSNGAGSPVAIMNSGDVAVASAGAYAAALYARSQYANSAVTITNSGDLSASSVGFGVGINAFTADANSPIMIVNSGGVSGSGAGIYSRSVLTSTSITNLAGGSISSGSGLAIRARDGAASIFNAGLINGFVDLTANADEFTNQSGGVFQAFGVSDFGLGDDLFLNKEGGVVDTANNPGAGEMVQFVGLETFQNFGTVSLVDGAAGDLFTISNTVGGTDLSYIAGSFLAVDAFLGGPGSRSDIFRIDGNVSGVTDVLVSNTNPLPGTFQPDGITVVQVRGDVYPNAFRLANGPIDTGFFNFDLFFEPRNGGAFDEFELRSFPGGGAFLLPQLITAAQDIWHETSDTWFDRSADLRTQLWRNGGSVPGVPGAMYLHGGSAKDAPVAVPGGLSPAVWAKVSHGELHDDSARTSAFGRSFNFNLDRDLYIIDVQSGVDVALKGVMNPSDVLLLSVFGGGVSANLTYDNLDGRRFDYEGGQVGVAATYLSGGLFVDALFNAQFLEIEPKAFGFSKDLDADNYGFRVDTGYRFESGRTFFEPLLTLAYVDSDIDGFSFAGNTVSFQAEDSLRARVGLRAGTSLTMGMARFEPFVIASLWGELSDDDNRATLVSNGARFGFRDEREDSWGEVSLGTNTFLFGSNAVSAFSKVDIIFGEDTEGYMASGGFRVQW